MSLATGKVNSNCDVIELAMNSETLNSSLMLAAVTKTLVSVLALCLK